MPEYVPGNTLGPPRWTWRAHESWFPSRFWYRADRDDFEGSADVGEFAADLVDDVDAGAGGADGGQVA